MTDPILDSLRLERDNLEREFSAARETIAAVRARCEELERHRDEYPAHILSAYRGVEPGDVCPACGGWGRRIYGSTSTWRGGIGGQAMTGDVCDRCWGTGSATRKGDDLRRMRAALESSRANEEKARGERDRLAVSLGALVRRLDEVHASGAFRRVWQIAMLHDGSYEGPRYVDELDAARALLAPAAPAATPET